MNSIIELCFAIRIADPMMWLENSINNIEWRAHKANWSPNKQSLISRIMMLVTSKNQGTDVLYDDASGIRPHDKVTWGQPGHKFHGTDCRINSAYSLQRTAVAASNVPNSYRIFLVKWWCDIQNWHNERWCTIFAPW